jgi:hypothetical protein
MIVDSFEIIKSHISTIAPDSIGFAEIREHINAAESWLCNDLTGSALFSFIEEEKDIPEHRELVEKIQRVIALNAFGRAVPFLNLVLTAAGFGVTNNEKIAPASKERIADLRDGLKSQCADAIEDLIIFLEKEETYRELWKESPSYSLFTDSLLPTFVLFKSYAPYSLAVDAVYPKCRIDFAKLRGKIRTVMASKITNAVGKATVDTLLEEIQANTLSATGSKIIEPLRFALAAYTLGLNDDGDMFISQALSIIKENPTDFPDFASNFADTEFKDNPIVNLC